jgi:putative endonuclease
MYYTYYLLSLVNRDLYIGSTDNIKKRFAQHNKGRVKSTKYYRPWKLLGFEEFASRNEAVKRERFLKNHQQKDLLKRKYNLAT